MNYKIVRYILGSVLKIEALCMLLPLICAFIYKEQTEIYSFLATIILCAVIGFTFASRAPENKSMYAKGGFVAVALSWCIISVFGALPFVLSGHIPNFIDALFETVSGFTTTGASILNTLENMPYSLLFWRSFTHWIGGMGVLVFLVAILPVAGSDNFFLMKAESPGPAVSKLVPNVRSTAKILYLIYMAFTLVEIVLLLLGGMTLFEALTLSFGTAGTGGFAILDSGIADYSSYSQIIITMFMIIFGVDFAVYHLILIKKANYAFKSNEVRWYLGIILSAIIIISIDSFGFFGNVFETVKHSAFQVASIITTTGYSTYDFNTWNSLSKTILVILMFIGACAGSTGGGIKVSRIIILIKSVIKEIKLAVHPKATVKVSMNGKLVEHETVRAINTFIAAYLAIFAASLLIISIDNFDFTTNFTAVAATLNNIGPGLSLVGPASNFSLFSPLSKIVLILDMLIGRLEIFPILLLLSPYTWKK